MRIALDAMGGDWGAAPNVAGALQAAAALPDLTIVLVGDPARIEPLLEQSSGPRERLEIVPATQWVEMHEPPVEALRRKPDNSISRCWQLLATRQVDAVVGAGSTGAMVAAGLRTRKFLPRIRRPGIAAVMPTAKGPCVIVDVGANVSPKPSDLLQYGIMGSIFAKHLLKREQPTIGLMNIGEEEGKGHDLVRDTFALFRGSRWRESFRGNVEGRDIHRGAVDVVVTDGFTGNVILKLSEGVLEFVLGLVKQEVIGSLSAERETAGQALRQLLGKYHYSAFGGAPLLGIDGICLICHGSSNDRAICSALLMAANYARARLNEIIVTELEALPPDGDEPAVPALDI
ncbi:MAG: phosphate acyltransferase PlsX [Gemmataceae bacterium]|nr:phosphate acyltransferase PlsX [Gemmataceae bacterium]